MEGLGALGFWLGLGIFLGAGTIAGALKERDKEREKQATLRALLEKGGGEGTSEILAYLRERDAAEAARAHAEWVAMGGDMSLRTVVAGVVACLLGVALFLIGLGLGVRLMSVGEAPWYIGFPAMLGAWTVGLLISIVIFRVIRGRKKAPAPGA